MVAVVEEQECPGLGRKMQNKNVQKVFIMFVLSPTYALCFMHEDAKHEIGMKT